MLLNIDEYMDCLDTLELSRKQKEQIIRAVWSFMESEVDKIFGLHPVQQCRGYASNDNLQSPALMVNSKQSPALTEFDCAANDNTYTTEQKRYG